MSSTIKAMTRKEMCAQLHINNRTLNNWLDTAGLKLEDTKRKRIFTPAQVKKFYDHIGFEPEN